MCGLRACLVQHFTPSPSFPITSLMMPPSSKPPLPLSSLCPLPINTDMDDNALLAEAHVGEAQVQSQELYELVAKWRGEEIDLGTLPGGCVGRKGGMEGGREERRVRSHDV